MYCIMGVHLLLWLVDPLCSSSVMTPVASDRMRLDAPVVCDPGTDAVFQYDDGTASWITWGGISRGVWFHMDDFVPRATGAEIDATEFWFYHHASYPWDTTYFYAEIWTGDSGGPATMLDQTSVSASHYTSVFVYYDPPVEVPSDFWVVVNTEMSVGGWPAIVGDQDPQVPDHSFFCDDQFGWEPWGTGDYLIRSHGEATLNALESETWGSIKHLF